LLQIRPRGYISKVARTGFLVFRVDPALRRDVERIADEEQRTITQICELLLHEGVEAYKKEGSKFMQRLIAKQKLRSK
jgi:hypothetical protein